MKFSAVLSTAFHLCTAFGLYKLLLELHFIIWRCNISNEHLDLNSSLFILQDGSSAWCIGSNKSERICKFRNLCYHPLYDEYIFFHGPRTVLSGVPRKRFDPALLDLSSVADHNIHYFNFVDFPITSLESFGNISFLEGTSVVFHRFMPDNIMHVIHDDLLPMYHTLRQFSFGSQSVDLNISLVMMEDWDPGPYFDLYGLFTNKMPLLKKDLKQKNSMTCFLNAVVGITKATTWYQYGFSIPQGPLTDIKLRGHDIKQFTTFTRKKLGLNENLSLQTQDPYIVLVSRSHNRLIINELELAMAIATSFNMQVIRVSMETHSFKKQVELISKAKGLVGMHGSILIMSMFLSSGAFVVELFPYAVKSKNYTPYKTLLELPGMNIVYSVWHNDIERNTVTHPDEPPDIGGIMHLSKEEQEAVKASKEVPPHLCCSNPFWLYRIYQDTVVDIKSFIAVMEDSLRQSKTLEMKTNIPTNDLLFPSRVLNITCHSTTQQAALWLSWRAPWNMKTFSDENLQYEVWIQMKGEEDYKAYILNFTEHVFTDSLHADACYRVWVRCVANGMTGPFGDVTECKTY